MLRYVTVAHDANEVNTVVGDEYRANHNRVGQKKESLEDVRPNPPATVRKTLLQLVPTSFQLILVVAILPKGSDAGPIEGFRCNPTRAGRFHRATEMFTCL